MSIGQPREVWQMIVRDLPFLDVLNLSFTCKTYRSQFAARVQLQHEKLRERFEVVEGLQSHGKSKEESNSIGVVLELLLLRELDPNLIRYLLCYEVPWNRHELDYDWGASVAAIDHGQALRHRIESVPWILEHERPEIFSAILACDEAAALCLIVPALKNLEILRTYAHAPRMHEFIMRVAQDGAAHVLPRLIQVSGYPINGDDGLRLGDLAAYAALPSVRTVVAVCARSAAVEGDFAGWPDGLPLSKASRVVFLDSVVVKADVERWAAGFRGPCFMTQNWRGVGGEYPEGARAPDWDTLRITTQLEPGAGDITPSLRDVYIDLVNDRPDERSNSTINHGLMCLYE